MVRAALLFMVVSCGCGKVGDDGTTSGTSGAATPMSNGATSEDSGGQSETGHATAVTGSGASISTSDVPADTRSLDTGTTSTTAEPADTSTSVEPNDCNVIWGNTCDPWKQDCPTGQKCNWYSDRGGPWYDSKCFPVMEDPAAIGEPCFVVDSPVSGLDNCEQGAMCWDTDAENMGTCVALCGGCPEAGTCPTKSSCWSFSEGLSLCFESCNPLTQDCLNPGDLCTVSGGYGNGFQCTPDSSGDQGQPHDPCNYLNDCDPGSLCVGTAAAVECNPQASACCEPFCDTTLPNTCPGQGQECLPVYGDEDYPLPAYPEFPNVGYCTLPG